MTQNTNSTGRQQFLPGIQRIGNFSPGTETIAIAADTTAGGSSADFPDIQLKSPASDVLVYNSGSVDVFIAFGDSSVTVAIPTDGSPANGVCIPSKNSYVLDKGQKTSVAAITGSSSATIYFTVGVGS